jgi:hypothetical protein
MHWTSMMMSDIMPDTMRLDMMGTARMWLLSHSALACITSLRLICCTCGSSTTGTTGGPDLLITGCGCVAHDATSTLLIKINFFILSPSSLCSVHVQLKNTEKFQT